MNPDNLPRASQIARPTRDHARSVAEAEFAAMLELLRDLNPDDWDKSTDCDKWNVFALVSHLCGTCQDSAHPGSMLRRGIRAVRSRGVGLVDAMNASQVAERRGIDPEALIAEFETVGPVAIRARWKMPRILRALRIPLGGGGVSGTVSIGYLNDVLYSRDMWTHRVDLSLATGRTPLYRGHEREIIEQVISDLGRIWKARTCVIELEGYLNAAWILGEGEPIATVTVNCIEYMRTLSGRNDEPLVVVEGEPGLADAVAAARVFF